MFMGGKSDRIRACVAILSWYNVSSREEPVLKPPGIGLIIIGNEILSGGSADRNIHFLCRELFALGARVGEVAVVSDHELVVAGKLRDFMPRFDLVITTGGIGPTHDDITSQAVARAVGQPLEVHPELLALAERKRHPLNDAARKLTMVPRGAELLAGGDFIWPPVKVENVVVLPGIPELVVAQFGAIASLIVARPFVVRQVKCYGHEVALAAAAALTDAHYADVEVGSYPIWAGGESHVLMRFTASEEDRCMCAVSDFLARLPKGVRTAPLETGGP
jgi:molybdenum cofactor synthesis domain-containing protein